MDSRARPAKSRRNSELSPRGLHFGRYRLAGLHGPLYVHDGKVRLPPKALALLWLLVSQGGQVLTKAALLDGVWGETAVGEDALAFQIQGLRQAPDLALILCCWSRQPR
jgi:DNA-binding winged helix-turn-helix (wHTH) protein